VSPARAGGVLAIDHGTKRTGFAVTDALHIATFALDTFQGDGNGDALLDHVEKLCAERAIATFLVGYPFNMDGTRGGRAQDVDRFIARLQSRFRRIDVVRWDERLTTKAADEMLVEAGHTGADRKARRDSWSALVLLRDWLESVA
jgi:putative Holliday junction resolvase